MTQHFVLSNGDCMDKERRGPSRSSPSRARPSWTTTRVANA